MESARPANGTVNPAPPSDVNTGGQGQSQPIRQPMSFTVPSRNRLWKVHTGDMTLALRSLAVSFGAIFGLLLFLVPGAAALAVEAFWHPDLILTWPVSLAISFGASLVLLLALMILTAPIGGRASPFFIVLAVAALVTLGVVRHRDLALVDALWNHLTR